MGFVSYLVDTQPGPESSVRDAAHMGYMRAVTEHENTTNGAARIRADEAVIGMIWAQDVGGIIGANGTIPWDLPEDLANFSAITRGHPVIMGRRTWESLPGGRPLPGRTNIVVTSDPDFSARGAVRAGSLAAAMIEAGRSGAGSDKIWIIGGARLYAEALKLADTVVMTRVDLDVEGDTRAPELGPDWVLEEVQPVSGVAIAASGTRYRYERWTAS